MSRNLAHRPRYRSMHYIGNPRLNVHQPFLRKGWTYRRTSPTYEKRSLGYGLSLIPLNYRLFNIIIV